MRKPIRYCFAILLLLSSISASAQKHFASNVSVGGKGGVTLSKVNFSPSVVQSWNIGETAGVTFRYMEEKHFGLIIEANMARIGWKELFEESDYNYQRNLTYVQVPILTHIYFGSQKCRGFFNLGPQFGYMLGSNISSNFDYANIGSIPDFPSQNRHTDQLTLDIKNNFDYGLAFGAGAEFIAKRKHSFVLEGRFYYGLGSIFGSNKKDTFSASSNMSVMVTLGYYYRIK